MARSRATEYTGEDEQLQEGEQGPENTESGDECSRPFGWYGPGKCTIKRAKTSRQMPAGIRKNLSWK
jgi:hypothetical protein